MMKKMQYCVNCGEELGVYYLGHREWESCGKLECNRALRDGMEASEAERREEAERDGYSRYGG